VRPGRAPDKSFVHPNNPTGASPLLRKYQYQYGRSGIPWTAVPITAHADARVGVKSGPMNANMVGHGPGGGGFGGTGILSGACRRQELWDRGHASPSYGSRGVQPATGARRPGVSPLIPPAASARRLCPPAGKKLLRRPFSPSPGPPSAGSRSLPAIGLRPGAHDHHAMSRTEPEPDARRVSAGTITVPPASGHGWGHGGDTVGPTGSRGEGSAHVRNDRGRPWPGPFAQQPGPTPLPWRGRPGQNRGRRRRRPITADGVLSWPARRLGMS
jgi:hypothetical protein